ncbi:MAG: tRNA (N6-isopentenyl adenosine(37)-C2)-methylthiotransferase MiaB [Clostridiales Family XIII bacterium]|nr:tRNA (N6-isopentenyl adenosine(37)-C2)-methylthiotransferase MiaB [Clostridiales Family XIII bacterium]
MNERDSETLAGMLSDLGYRETMDRNKADVIIMNTCSVRENADRRFFGNLGQLKRIKEERPDVIIAVCGCMMQQQHIIDTLKSKYTWVDLVFGTYNIHEFPKLLGNVLDERKKVVDVWDQADEIVEGLPAQRKHPYKAFVNIMYGCDNFCSYCIVPYTRGRERSRDPEAILEEVKALVADGVLEITLLGQNVNSYRGQIGNQDKEEADGGKVMDSSGEYVSFAGLIHMLNEVEGLKRIRFTTSHPKDLSDELIDAFASCEKLCPHIHLPVQSGSTRILEKMNRKYTKEEYLELVEKLRRKTPDIAITTDIIVGFPGETEEDFEETLDIVRKVGFDSAFTFLYSIRKGTTAENFPDQVAEEVKHERFNRLVEEMNRIFAEKNKALVGQVVEVLAEGKSKTNKALYSGRTGGHKLVNFKTDEDVTGRMVKVLITESSTFSLTGRAI